MNQLQTLKKLHELAEMAFNHEIRKLALITEEEAEPLKCIADIENQIATLRSRPADSEHLGLALYSAATDNWIAWARKQEKQQRLLLAQIAERKEKQRLLAQKAFGKKSALDQLIERAKVQ